MASPPPAMSILVFASIVLETQLEIIVNCVYLDSLVIQPGESPVSLVPALLLGGALVARASWIYPMDCQRVMHVSKATPGGTVTFARMDILGIQL